MDRHFLFWYFALGDVPTWLKWADSSQVPEHKRFLIFQHRKRNLDFWLGLRKDILLTSWKDRGQVKSSQNGCRATMTLLINSLSKISISTLPCKIRANLLGPQFWRDHVGSLGKDEGKVYLWFYKQFIIQRVSQEGLYYCRYLSHSPSPAMEGISIQAKRHNGPVSVQEWWSIITSDGSALWLIQCMKAMHKIHMLDSDIYSHLQLHVSFLMQKIANHCPTPGRKYWKWGHYLV